MPICVHCKQDKPRTEYNLRWRNKNGLEGSCKTCQSAYKRAWRDGKDAPGIRKIPPTDWEYRGYFQTDEAWESAMNHAKWLMSKGFHHRASRVKFNIDGACLANVPEHV